jgi:hypothetical protein
MKPKAVISRREFLQVFGCSVAAFALPGRWFPGDTQAARWPTLTLEKLPERVAQILRRTPRTRIDGRGNLILYDPDSRRTGRAPLAQTLWNKERSTPHDRLYNDVPWGIVLHWYGDKENFDKSIKGYLRGFDSLREVAGYETRTSAHFLVGSHEPALDMGQSGDRIGIIQTQVPDQDGTPFLASHLKPLDILAHKEKKQYFVRALYQLGYQEPGVHSLLQDMYDGRYLDPNMRTLAIEICGYDFENPQHYPPVQMIANVLSVVWSMMKRYGIRASDVLGHNEIQLNKADPGKKFMALMRFLIGAKALLEDDDDMKRLVFGQFLAGGVAPEVAVRKYFQFVRGFLVMTGTPRHVYEWELHSQYWPVVDLLQADSGIRLARNFTTPLQGPLALRGFTFLDPTNHEGVDLYHTPEGSKASQPATTPVHLVADGVCLYTGPTGGCAPGSGAMFRHRLPQGAEVVSVYGHLHGLGDLQPGRSYPAGYPLGGIQGRYAHSSSFLHYALAYGATWETELSKRPDVPLYIGETWIRDRYLKPVEFL